MMPGGKWSLTLNLKLSVRCDSVDVQRLLYLILRAQAGEASVMDDGPSLIANTML